MKIEEMDLERLLRTDFQFRERGRSLPPEMRASWRLSMLLLVIAVGTPRGDCSPKRLHLLNWSLMSSGRREQLRRVLSFREPTYGLLIRMDPALDRAVTLAVGEGLVEHKTTGKLKITESGRDVVAAIEADEIFSGVRSYLSEVGIKLTDKHVDRIFTWEPLK